MLAYISENETIHLGEFFGFGIMASGCSLEIQRWIKDGDVIKIKIKIKFKKICTLRNCVVRSKQ